MIKYWITQVGITVLLIGGISFLKPALEFSPQGIALPITAPTAKIASASAIALYSSQHPPVDTIELANINVELHAKQESTQAKNKVLKYAQHMAAEYGANALVVTNFGYDPGEGYPNLAKYYFSATAIKTQGEANYG